MEMSEKRQVNGSPSRLARLIGPLTFVILTAAICLVLFGSPLWAFPDPNPLAQNAPTATPSLSLHETNLAQQSPTVRIEPAQSTVTAGETFTVSVMIDDASDLGGFEFDLLYIPAIITVGDVTLGDFPGSTGRTVIPIGPIIDNEAGKTSFGATTAGIGPGPNGMGELAIISLTARGEGESPLDLQNVLLVDTFVNPQVATDEDGSVLVESGPTPTATPIETPTGTPTATPTFTPMAGRWVIETVDSGGGFNSLALDEGEYPHISYFAGFPQFDLKYAYKDSAGWHIETVDSEGYVGSHISLALDGDGYPHISYRDSDNDALKYAYQDASGWHIEIFDSEGGFDTSLALDGDGYPHISYSNSGLKYAHQDASGWHIETVDSEGDVVSSTSLALDGDGYPHISYTVETLDNTYVSYAYQDASGWHIQTVESGGWVGWYTSLALDEAEYPHISYYNCGTPFSCDVRDLKYAYEDSGGWHIETVDSVGTAFDTSLALDEDEYPHISYSHWHVHNSNLKKYAYHDAYGWHIQTVDVGSAHYVGGDIPLVLDESGYPHISYWSSGHLNYAYYTESPPAPTPTPTPTDTTTPTPTPITPTPTPTPITPTPTPTPSAVEVCYCCSSGDSVYRIDASSFSGYTTTSAHDSSLIHVTSPPAPLGWNQPDFVPDSSWQLGSEVWSHYWAAPNWSPLPGDCRPIGLRDENGNQEAWNGTTHLYRRTFTLSPPQVGMQVTQAVLEMWSDNKTEWWWQGTSISYDREGYPGPIDLLPAHIEPHGGTYVLAIQNSNDYVCDPNCNPQGTACRLCITWTSTGAPVYQVYLPIILK